MISAFRAETAPRIKKPGGENESSSRVEVIGWNYEKVP
jgi:hypothetical protein